MLKRQTHNVKCKITNAKSNQIKSNHVYWQTFHNQYSSCMQYAKIKICQMAKQGPTLILAGQLTVSQNV